VQRPPAALPSGASKYTDALKKLRLHMLNKSPNDRPTAASILKSKWGQNVMATFLERKMETTMLEKKKKMMRPSSRLEDRDPGLAAALALQDRAARAKADQRRQELEAELEAAEDELEPTVAVNFEGVGRVAVVQNEFQMRQAEAARNRLRCVEPPPVYAAPPPWQCDEPDVCDEDRNWEPPSKPNAHHANQAAAKNEWQIRQAEAQRNRMRHLDNENVGSPSQPPQAPKDDDWRVGSPPGNDRAKDVKQRAQRKKQQEADAHAAALAEARVAAFADRKKLEDERRRDAEADAEAPIIEETGCDSFLPDSTMVVGEELSEQLSPKSHNSPGQETLLRIAREENYRERKALQAKYQQAAQAEEVEEDIEEDLFPCVEEELDDILADEEEEVELCSMLDTMQGQLFVTARAGLYLDEDAVLDGNGEPIDIKATESDSTTTKLEAIRAFLEDALGMDLFIEAYSDAVSQLDDGKNMASCSSSTLAEEHAHLWNIVLLVAKHN